MGGTSDGASRIFGGNLVLATCCRVVLAAVNVVQALAPLRLVLLTCRRTTCEASHPI
jgi:hypothetical protein